MNHTLTVSVDLKNFCRDPMGLKSKLKKVKKMIFKKKDIEEVEEQYESSTAESEQERRILKSSF